MSRHKAAPEANPPAGSCVNHHVATVEVPPERGVVGSPQDQVVHLTDFGGIEIKESAQLIPAAARQPRVDRDGDAKRVVFSRRDALIGVTGSSVRHDSWLFLKRQAPKSVSPRQSSAVGCPSRIMFIRASPGGDIHLMAGDSELRRGRLVGRLD